MKKRENTLPVGGKISTISFGQVSQQNSSEMRKPGLDDSANTDHFYS